MSMKNCSSQNKGMSMSGSKPAIPPKSTNQREKSFFFITFFLKMSIRIIASNTCVTANPIYCLEYLVFKTVSLECLK